MSSSPYHASLWPVKSAIMGKYEYFYKKVNNCNKEVADTWAIALARTGNKAF